MLRQASARLEQSLPNTLTRVHAGDRVRSVHAGRTGTAVKTYADGSAVVCWDDGEPQPCGMGHERMPRSLLEVIDGSAEGQSDVSSALQIVADALRAAAFAATPSDALDIAGAALARIANVVRAVPAASVEPAVVNPFNAAKEVADETMRLLDRAVSLFEAIDRLSADDDSAISDLASMGRELLAAESHRVDVAFIAIRRDMLLEARHA